MTTVADRVIVPLSLKGGAGKTTWAVSLAVNIASEHPELRVGLWDLDTTNPSCATALGIEEAHAQVRPDQIEPVMYAPNLAVMSVAFMLPKADQPILFNESMKTKVIRQIMDSVAFGHIDVLVVDTPPTQSRELQEILALFDHSKLEMVFITQPSALTENAVRKSLRYLKEEGLPLKGLICNMNGLICAQCGHHNILFVPGSMTPEALASKYGVPFLGSVPIGEDQNGNILTGPRFREVAGRVMTGRTVRFKRKKGKIPFIKKAMAFLKMLRRVNSDARTAKRK